jgi:uncharacterized phage protein (predicted DNA packaging)
MIITTEKAKQYLRVDSSDDDELIGSIRDSAEIIVADAWRTDSEGLEENRERAETAIYYTIGYLYEHREDADHATLMRDLRALGDGVREAAF